MASNSTFYYPAQSGSCGLAEKSEGDSMQEAEATDLHGYKSAWDPTPFKVIAFQSNLPAVSR